MIRCLLYRRSAIWERNFRPFMDERDRRRELKERDAAAMGDGDRFTANGKLRRKYTKRQAAGNATTSEAVLSAGAGGGKGASKKINYEALKVRRGVHAPPSLASAVPLILTWHFFHRGCLRETVDSLPRKRSAPTAAATSP